MLKTASDPAPRLLLRAEGPASLLLRPDHLRAEISVQVLELEVSRAVALVESAVDAAARDLASALPGARVVLAGLDLRRNLDKSSRASQEIAAVVCSGHIHVPLPADAGYWPRARAVATLHAILAAAAAGEEEGRRQSENEEKKELHALHHGPLRPDPGTGRRCGTSFLRGFVLPLDS